MHPFNRFIRAHITGNHPDQVMQGVSKRQALAVLNYREHLLTLGLSEDNANRRTADYLAKQQTRFKTRRRVKHGQPTIHAIAAKHKAAIKTVAMRALAAGRQAGRHGAVAAIARVMNTEMPTVLQAAYREAGQVTARRL